MKKIIFAFLTILSVGSKAQEFQLSITENNQIIYNEAVWQQAAQSNIFQLYVHKASLNIRQRQVPVYSVTEFNDPAGQKYEMLEQPVYKIYTFGLLDCQTALFNIINHWFVDKDNKIVYNDVKSVGSYIVDMSANNTPRNDLYRLVGNK